MATNQGKLYVIEGIDGAGKSAQVAAVHAALKGRGMSIVQVAEPGRTPMGMHLREILLANDVRQTGEEMLLTFTLQREYLLRTVIKPTIESGTSVISDRSILSTLVYQSVQGVRTDRILEVSREVVEALQWIPKQVFILDVDPLIAMQRMANEDARRTINHFDVEALDKHQMRRNRYLEAYKMLNWEGFTHVMDASSAIEDVTEDILSLIA